MCMLVNILLGLLAKLFNLEEPVEDVPHPQVEGNPPCCFFLLDNSGSMGKRDAPGGSLSRREAARRAAGGTVEYLADHDKRALVGIGSFADLFHHVAGPALAAENLEAITDALRDLGEPGWTAMGRGLRGILKMVRKCPAESRKVLLVLTDGRQNEGEDPEPVARKLREEHGVDIHTIGIGGRDKVDEQRLRRIAPDQYTFLENWDPDGLLEEFKRKAQLIHPDEV